jgi:ATP-dependent DNA helicase
MGLLDSTILPMFSQILVPFLLRRVKADVAVNIPPKKELLVYAPMSPVQLKLYRATVEHNYSRLMRKAEEVKQITVYFPIFTVS